MSKNKITIKSLEEKYNIKIIVREFGSITGGRYYGWQSNINPLDRQCCDPATNTLEILESEIKEYLKSLEVKE